MFQNIIQIVKKAWNGEKLCYYLAVKKLSALSRGKLHQKIMVTLIVWVAFIPLEQR